MKNFFRLLIVISFTREGKPL